MATSNVRSDAGIIKPLLKTITFSASLLRLYITKGFLHMILLRGDFKNLPQQNSSSIDESVCCFCIKFENRHAGKP
jgi:hypothetical protein